MKIKRKNKKKKQFSKFVRIFLTLLIFLTLNYLSWNLPSTPMLQSIYFFEGVVLVLFILINIFNYFDYGYSKKDIKKHVIAGVMFFVALFIGILSSNPSYLSYEEVNDIYKSEVEAAEFGIEVSKDTEVLTEAKELIETRYRNEPKNKEIAEEALENAQQDSDTSEEEIVAETVDTVPVINAGWTCVEIGCTYAGSGHVWFINSQSRMYATILVAISSTFLVIFSIKKLII